MPWMQLNVKFITIWTERGRSCIIILILIIQPQWELLVWYLPLLASTVANPQVLGKVASSPTSPNFLHSHLHSVLKGCSLTPMQSQSQAAGFVSTPMIGIYRHGYAIQHLNIVQKQTTPTSVMSHGSSHGTTYRPLYSKSCPSSWSHVQSCYSRFVYICAIVCSIWINAIYRRCIL